MNVDFTGHSPCILCNLIQSQTKHHLIPRAIQQNSMSCVRLCLCCHRWLHTVFTNETLATQLYTREALEKHPFCQLRKSRLHKKVSEVVQTMPEPVNIARIAASVLKKEHKGASERRRRLK